MDPIANESQADLPALVLEKCLELAETVLGQESAICLFVFGSRATGRAASRSDVDLGIDAGHPLAAETLDRIQEAMDGLPILQKVDCVDFARLEGGFREMAMRNRVVIYERKTVVSPSIA